jgi:hypothetical protein
MNRAAWILAGLFVVLVVVLIFMLGDGGGEETTTSSSSAVSSMPETTTTMPTTTTSVSETTTTSLEETTTTVEETTTTLLAGNWAADPVVMAGFGALGWWDGSSWVQVQPDTTLPLSGGESYQVAVLGLQATITGGAPETVCEPLENPGVSLANDQLLGDWPGPYGVAISAPWDITPHLVEELSDDGTYAAFASQLLSERGLSVPNPVIKQLIRADLDGDGVNEVIVVSEDVTPGLLAEPGDYSIVFMRKAVQGEVQTAVLGDSVVLDIAEGETPFVTSFSVGAVSDLNGDGKMEVVVSSAYYEGLGVEVWEYVNDDLGPVMQISQGCGV